DCKGRGNGGGEDRGEAEPVKGLSVLAAINKSVERRWRHEKNDRERNAAESRHVGDFRSRRQVTERFGQHDGELESKQGLRARNEHAGFRQHLLDTGVEWRAMVRHGRFVLSGFL